MVNMAYIFTHGVDINVRLMILHLRKLVELYHTLSYALLPTTLPEIIYIMSHYVGDSPVL